MSVTAPLVPSEADEFLELVALKTAFTRRLRHDDLQEQKRLQRMQIALIRQYVDAADEALS